MGVCLLVFCAGVLTVGRFRMNLGTDSVRTLAFIVLVFGSQATIYAIRERRRLWGIRLSLFACGVVSRRYRNHPDIGRWRNRNGPLPALLVAGTLAAAAAFAFVFRKGSDIRASRDHPERAPIINPMHGKPYARAAPLATNE
jgi:H+-transporting ATPase